MDARKLWGFFARNVSTKTDLPPFKFDGNLAQVARNTAAGCDIRTVLAPYTDKSSVGPSRTQTFREIQRRLDADTSYGGLPTLHSAIWATDDPEAVKVILEMGANPDLPDPKKGLRPAQVRMMPFHCSLVILLDYGCADPKKKKKNVGGQETTLVQLVRS
jgi:hypothetical protein